MILSFLEKYCLFLLKDSKTFLKAYLLGVFLAAALPPLTLFPFAFIALISIFLLLERTSNKSQAFKLGWFFGLGYFMAGLYWISYALSVDWERFFWVLPLALFTLPAILALFIALPFYLFKHFSLLSNLTGLFFFCFLLTLFEWLRGFLFTGFPWNPFASLFSWSLSLLQPLSLFGTYGLGFIALFIITLPVLSRLNPFSYKGLRPCFMSLLLLLGFIFLGHLRLKDSPLKTHDALDLYLIQPNITQRLKWDPLERVKNFQKLLTLSKKTSSKGKSLLIWPEAAIPFYLEEDLLNRLEASSLLNSESFLITGGTRRKGATLKDLQAWNSLFVLNADGNILNVYDKYHLTPFGEYIPFRNLLTLLNLSGIQKITHGTIDFSAGSGLTTLQLPGVPTFSPLICYEGIFPGFVKQEKGRPEWLLNITNDGWFGPTSGPYQHFETMRFRAIEEGVPAVRVANTGISGVIDSYGRILATLPYDQEGFLQSKLPLAAPSQTLYSQYGNSFFLSLLTLSACLISCLNLKKKFFS